MEYVFGLVALLFLQTCIYSASYYITRAIIRTRLGRDRFNKQKGYLYLCTLYLVSVGSFFLFILGVYRPVVILAVIVALIGGGRWLDR